MKYMVLLKQKRAGCDHTIGCGMRFDEVEAQSEEDLIERVLWPEGRAEASILESEDGVACFMFAPVSEFKAVDVDSILKGIKSAKQAAADSARRDADRAEYERLKRKYGE